MREADLHYETHISVDIEEASQNLSENLHLKWNYGFLFIDKFSDERGLPVSIISGIRKDDETQHYLRIHLISEQKGVYCRIDIWRVITTGWPFPAGVMGTSKTDKLIDLVDDITEFCQTPYKETGGVMSQIRNMFTGTSNLETRKYKD